MLTPLTQLVRRRYMWNSVFAGCEFMTHALLTFVTIHLIDAPRLPDGRMITPPISSLSLPYPLLFDFPWPSIIGAVFFFIVFALSLGMFFKWKSGKVIKTIYIFSALLFIASLVMAYIMFFEKNVIAFEYNGLRWAIWNIISLILSTIVFILSASVHYTILSDQEKRKVCEFC